MKVNFYQNWYDAVHFRKSTWGADGYVNARNAINSKREAAQTKKYVLKEKKICSCNHFDTVYESAGNPWEKQVKLENIQDILTRSKVKRRSLDYARNDVGHFKLARTKIGCARKTSWSLTSKWLLVGGQCREWDIFPNMVLPITRRT